MINDPRLLELNETQLVFEAESINVELKQKYEDISLMARAATKKMINLLGLNMMPIEDPKTKLLRMPEDHEIMPLVAFTGQESILKGLKERLEDMEAQNLAMKQIEEEKKIGKDTSTEEFLDFMESDIEFIDEDEAKRLAIIKSPEYAYTAKSVIKDLDKTDMKDFGKMFGLEDRNLNEIKKVLSQSLSTSSVEIDDEAVPMETNSLENIQIESEEIVNVPTSNKKKKFEIIIESDDE